MRLRRTSHVEPSVDLTRPAGAGVAGDVDWSRLAADPRFTESTDDLPRLYDVVRYGQLNASTMRALSDQQILFLAAHDPAVQSFDREMADAQEEIRLARANFDVKAIALGQKKFDDIAAMKNKLEQNARRARLELGHRELTETRKLTRRLTLYAAAIGVVGALLGAGVAAIASAGH
jgi:hypothetical protein